MDEDDTRVERFRTGLYHLLRYPSREMGRLSRSSAVAWVAMAVRLLVVSSLLMARPSNAQQGAAPPAPDDPSVSAQWVTRSWRAEDGLPNDSVVALAQTREGFLWVGTSAGLARFDGVRFRTYGLQDGLRSVNILTLAEDRQGGLWIGTSGGGVSRWADGRITSYGLAEQFPTSADVLTLAAEPDGSMWIGTTDGLVHWRGGKFSMVTEAQGLPRKQIRALLRDAHGTLWVSVISAGLFRGVDSHFSRVEKPGPVEGNVYCLAEGTNGTVWAGTSVLWKWKDGVWQQIATNGERPEGPIESLCQSRDGALWIGSRKDGLLRYRAQGFGHAAREGPLSEQNVKSILMDNEGSLWIGVVAGGLHRLSPRILQYWDREAGLPKTAVTSAAEDSSETLWVGTASGGVMRFENGRFRSPEEPPSAAHAIIYAGTATSRGDVWFGGEQCLYQFPPGQPGKGYLDHPVRDEAIRALCADGDALWAGTYYGTLLKCENGTVETAAPRGTFPAGVSCLALEAPGILWVGTTAGLHRWDHGKLHSWTTRDGLLTANIRALHREADGTVWLGTLGGGLVRFKDGRFTHLTTRQGLIDNAISQIMPDDFGALWLGSNRGLMRLDRLELNAVADGKATELRPIVFGRNEGMRKEQCFGGTSPTVVKLRDGRLCFPTMNGLAEIDPRRLPELTTLTPQAHIDEINVDQQPQPLASELVIPPGKHHLELAYAAPLLRGGEWLRYRYRLEGFDPGWIAAGGRLRASYDGLPPGRYTFRVSAADAMGTWDEPGATLAFSVLPYFWETLWFRLGALAFLIAVSGAAVWWYQHRKYLRHLAELDHERKQQAELAHASRVALLGQLSASIAHELKQPLAAILSNAQAGLRFLNQDSAPMDEVRAILRDIASEDRRASEIISHMRAMMQKGGMQMEPRDLNADVHFVLRLIHGELTRRNVTVETQLAADLPAVRGDHIQLQQVLLNLVMNGCDAMHATQESERLIVITTAREDDGHIGVSVVDRGAGLSPGVLEHIFEPFYSTKTTGLGMGLAICDNIIKAHGGRLWATNNAGHGATFHFTLLPGT